MANDTAYFSNKLRTQAVTLYFPLPTFSATDPSDSFVTAPAVHAAGDTKISKDGGAFGNTTNGFAHLGNGIYSLALTATEMDADIVVVTVVDQSGPKIWKDRLLQVETLRTVNGVLRQELAQAGGASTITLDTGASAVNDFYKGALVAIVAGTGAGQCRAIRSYVGATQVATVGRAWATNPDATSLYVILPGGEVQLDPFGVDDVWDDSEGSEPSSALASVATMRAILQHFKRWAFNRGTATNSSRTTFKDDSVTPLETQTFSSDGTTSDRGKAQ
jgi:hypothetical protein